MCKFKFGDVILNEHASDKNPIKKSIVWNRAKINGSDCYKCLYIQSNGTYGEAYYDISITDKDDSFKKIGHIDLIGFIKDELGKFDNQGNKIQKRAQTGILDATGRQILDGDIIVYTRWWQAKDIEHKDEILKDLVNNYDKYQEKIGLHPVFWDDDLHIFCTDTHSDRDPLYKIDTQYVYVVSNKIEHPELYNY